MPRLSSLQHRDHCYLLLCCTVFVLVVYSCSWIIVVCSWCVWPARGLLVAYSWLLLCDVIVVCAACSWCVHTCGLFVLVVRVIYLWCVRALGLLVLVVCVACSWRARARARARGLLALVVCSRSWCAWHDRGVLVVCSFSWCAWCARGVFVLMVYSCSWCRVVCLQRVRGFCSWFLLVVRVTCSWCV